MNRTSIATHIMTALMMRNPRLDVPAEHFAEEAIRHADVLIEKLAATRERPYKWETLDEAEKRISLSDGSQPYPQGDE